MLPLAITGGIAEGKSTVLEVLRTEGLQVVSADSLVAGLWENPTVLAGLAEALDVKGEISKIRVREIIGTQPAARRMVNQYFHPLVVDAMTRSKAEAIEVPLLIETCLQTHFKAVWVVTCGPAIQLERVNARPDAESARRLMASQLPTRVKIPFADEVIRTIGSVADVHTPTLNALTRHRGR